MADRFFNQYQQFAFGEDVAKDTFLDNFAGKDAMRVLTYGLLLVGLMSRNFGHRRKRDTQTDDTESLLENLNTRQSNIFYQIISDLDDDDCLALTLCHVSSMEENQRTNEQTHFMDAFRVESGTPLPWTSLKDNKAKYQYAAFVGGKMKENPEGRDCREVFNRCLLNPEDILKILGQSTRSTCEKLLEPPQRKIFVDEELLKKSFLDAFLTGNHNLARENPSGSREASMEPENRMIVIEARE